MKVLYKSDTDYIPLPSKDPFVQKQQALLIEMGYRLIEDWEPPTDDEQVPLAVSEVTETETVEETVAEETVTTSGTSSPGSDDSVIVVNGKTYTKTEIEAVLKNL